jgi:hypothetical protein
VETNATRVAGQPIRVQVEQRDDRSACSGCGAAAWFEDRPVVELVDLGCFGAPGSAGVAQVAVCVTGSAQPTPASGHRMPSLF